MKKIAWIRTYLSELTPRAVRLLAAGLVPIFLSLLFVVLAHTHPPLFPGGTEWLVSGFALWVDSIGISLLLLLSGAVILDYAEKHDPK